MGIRKAPEAAHVAELVKMFPVWRQERLPGTKVLQSTYDKFVHVFSLFVKAVLIFSPRVGNMVCKWLLLLLSDVLAVTFFDVVLPLMPELIRFCECKSLYFI